MKMYSLRDVEDDVESITSYIVEAMKKEGKSSEEINLYKSEVENAEEQHLISISVSMLDELNGLHTRQAVRQI